MGYMSNLKKDEDEVRNQGGGQELKREKDKEKIVEEETRTRRRFTGRGSKRTRIMEETREQGWERGTKTRKGRRMTLSRFY